MAWPREDLAWAAGFFEGEGSGHCSVNYWRKDGTKHPRHTAKIYLCITQVDREPLEKFQSIFGGTIYFRERREKNHNNQYQWMLHQCEHVQACIAAMWPWLSQRRREQVGGWLRKRNHVTVHGPAREVA